MGDNFDDKKKQNTFIYTSASSFIPSSKSLAEEIREPHPVRRLPERERERENSVLKGECEGRREGIQRERQIQQQRVK